MSKILSVQFEPVLNNIGKNLKTVENLLGDCKTGEIDLIVLPEFFSTGISHNGFFEASKKENFDKILNTVSNIAKRLRANICAGSVIEKDKDKLYNTSFVFDREGNNIAKYRKIHLYSYFGGSEGEVITAGKDIVAVPLDFCTVGLSVCFDIRFPALYRELTKNGAEILLCPNAWCLPQKQKSLIPAKTNEMRAFAVARACENLAYFAGASLTGTLGSGLLSASTSIITSPDACVLAIGEESKNQVICADIDLEFLRNLRKTHPVHLVD